MNIPGITRHGWWLSLALLSACGSSAGGSASTAALDAAAATASATSEGTPSAAAAGAAAATADPATKVQGGTSAKASSQPAASGADPTSPSTLELSSGSYDVGAAMGVLYVVVERGGDPSAAASVNYTTANGSALAGIDYAAVSGTLSWESGDASPQSFAIPILNDRATAKSFSVTLSGPIGASLATPPAATVTILAATPIAPTLTLTTSSYTVAPTMTLLDVVVERGGDPSSAASVNYATANGSAIAGTDYTASSGTLTWASGDAAPKSFSISILEDRTTAKSFSVTLSNPNGATLGAAPAATVTIEPGLSSTFGVQVQGTHFVDASGATLQLRGASASGLESVAIQGWDPSDPWGGWEPQWSVMQAWHINVVRLPMNEASWLAYTCVDGNGQSVNPDPGNNYKATVEQTVAAANAAGIYVILDLQWTAPGDYCPLGQNQMADTDHSIDFWTQIATTFKGNPAVMFELFNEPFLDRTSGSSDWNDWLSGGAQTQIESPLTTGYQWTSAGEQQLLDAVRATGATNVILIGGLSYSNDLTGWLSHAPQDPLHQLAAAWHVYSFNEYTSTVPGSSTVDMLSAVAATVPLIFTEFGDTDGPGSTGSFAKGIMNFADANGYSYLGWTWNYWGQSQNDLIIDSAGDPTIGFGTEVQQHYICRASQTNCD